MTVDHHFTTATRRHRHTAMADQSGRTRHGCRRGRRRRCFSPHRSAWAMRQPPSVRPRSPVWYSTKATSSTRVVQANLDAARQAGIRVGAAVTVDLPGGGRTGGKVASLGTVATVPSGNSGGGTDDRPTVPLTVALDDPAAGGTLDQQPVQVELVTDSRTNVLTVPVTALLALAEGALWRRGRPGGRVPHDRGRHDGSCSRRASSRSQAARLRPEPSWWWPVQRQKRARDRAQRGEQDARRQSACRRALRRLAPPRAWGAARRRRAVGLGKVDAAPHHGHA